jgi:hypothetical protein
MGLPALTSDIADSTAGDVAAIALQYVPGLDQLLAEPRRGSSGAPRLVNCAIQDGRYPLLPPIPADLSRRLGRLCSRDGDRLVAFGRAYDRLEHRNAVQDVLGRDRIGPLAADRRGEGFEFGQLRIKALVLDDLGGARGVAPGARPLGGWREAELELRGPELGTALAAEYGRSGC